MTDENIVLNTLSGEAYIQTNKRLSLIIGPKEATILGEIISEYKYYKSRNTLRDDTFTSTHKNILLNTGYSKREQLSAIDKLSVLGIISKEVLRLENCIKQVSSYKIDFSRLLDILSATDEEYDKILDELDNKTQTVENNNCLKSIRKQFEMYREVSENNNDCVVTKSTHDSNKKYSRTIQKVTTNSTKSISNNNTINKNTINKNTTINSPHPLGAAENLEKPKNSKVSKILDKVHKKCLEYDIEDDEVIIGIDKFFTNLVDNKKMITDEKIDATLNRLAPLSKQDQLNAIKFTLENSYQNINPDWMKNQSNSYSKEQSYHHSTHDTETAEEHNERVKNFKNDINKKKF